MVNSILQRFLFISFTAFLNGLQEVRRSRLASALATEGMIVNLKNDSVHVQYIWVTCVWSVSHWDFFFPDRSLIHQNPGATIPLEQMIPNVSAMAKNMIEDKMIVFSLFLWVLMGIYCMSVLFSLCCEF